MIVRRMAVAEIPEIMGVSRVGQRIEMHAVRICTRVMAEVRIAHRRSRGRDIHSIAHGSRARDGRYGIRDCQACDEMAGGRISVPGVMARCRTTSIPECPEIVSRGRNILRVKMHAIWNRRQGIMNEMRITRLLRQKRLADKRQHAPENDHAGDNSKGEPKRASVVNGQVSEAVTIVHSCAGSRR